MYTYVNSYPNLLNLYRGKHQGMLEPMSRMTMDFQGRYMDSMGRLVDPKYYDYYNSWHADDHIYALPMLSKHAWMDTNSFNWDGDWMNFPETYMDMSNYQMDMQGRWMDMHGRYVNPFSHSVYYPQYYHYGHWDFDYPERYMDMSGYQMDMQGRWMDMQGRYCNPFSNYSGWLSLQYPANYYYFGTHPERYRNMYRFQMDNYEQWVDNDDHY